MQKRSDWAWTKQVLGLAGWRGEGPDSRMCFKCGATKDGPRSFRDTSASAGWRPTMIDTRTFIKTILSAGKFLSVVFQWPGFQTLGLVLIQADLMHTGCLWGGAICLWEYLIRIIPRVGWRLFQPFADDVHPGNVHSTSIQSCRTQTICA